jgi:hypothetical protein
VRGLLAAEVRKLWTLRTMWILTVIGLGLVVLMTAEFLSASRDQGFRGADQAVTAIAQIGNNSIIVLVVALLITTTEFRHETIGHTLLVTPARARVLVAKLTAGALYAAAFWLASFVIVALLLLVLSVGDIGALIVSPEVGRTTRHGLAGLALTGVFGVAVGAVIRSQVVAITVSLVWLFLVENLAAALNYGIGRWLPFQALNAVFLGDAAEAIEPGLIGPLPANLALLVFIGYVGVTTTAAGALMRFRDV